MTNRERELAALGIEYAEGIERVPVIIIIPSTGREVRRVHEGLWEAQEYNDDYWTGFDDVIEAVRFATPPEHRK